jgi:3',5'-cyclic AMP phosphodiesterase CpdA
VRIRVLSDLHLEFQRWTPPAAPADVVVLAGDIHSGVEGIHWGREYFPHSEVINVPGNHEYYGSEMQEMLGRLRRTSKASGVHLLDADSVDISGVRFLGATLWTDFALDGDDPRDVARAMAVGQVAMADYDVIRREDGSVLTPNDTRAIHQLQLAWLRNELSKPASGSTVVVTHHLPHPKSIHAKYRGSPLNPGFASDLSDLVKAPVKLWIHGHTHESIDYEVEGTRVICNPRGYLPEEPNKKFMPKLVVEIDA